VRRDVVPGLDHDRPGRDQRTRDQRTRSHELAGRDRDLRPGRFALRAANGAAGRAQRRILAADPGLPQHRLSRV
jgi:hypothetical protein